MTNGALRVLGIFRTLAVLLLHPVDLERVAEQALQTPSSSYATVAPAISALPFSACSWRAPSHTSRAVLGC